MPAALDPICLFTVLSDHNVDFVLIGGLAAVLHGSTAMTNGADIVPRKELGNLNRLGQALVELEARIRSIDDPQGIAFEPHPALLNSVAMLNMTTRCGDLDMTFAPAGLDDYDDLDAASVLFDLGTTSVKVAALADIIHSKSTADRPKDRAVLPILYALQDEISRMHDRE